MPATHSREPPAPRARLTRSTPAIRPLSFRGEPLPDECRGRIARVTQPGDIARPGGCERRPSAALATGHGGDPVDEIARLATGRDQVIGERRQGWRTATLRLGRRRVAAREATPAILAAWLNGG